MLYCGILADNTRGANMFQYEAASCTVAVYLGRPQEYQDGQAQLNNVFMINHGGGEDQIGCQQQFTRFICFFLISERFAQL